MAHPQMFDDDDPMLARVRELALGFPEAAEKVSRRFTSLGQLSREPWRRQLDSLTEVPLEC